MQNKKMNKCNWCPNFTDLSGWFWTQRVRRGDKMYVYRRKAHRCRECNNKQGRAYYKKTNGKYLQAYNKLRSKLAPEKLHARQTLNAAVKKGVLIRPQICTQCKGKAKRIEAHHRDYTLPLSVEWLCTPCHYKADIRDKIAK